MRRHLHLSRIRTYIAAVAICSAVAMIVSWPGRGAFPGLWGPFVLTLVNFLLEVTGTRLRGGGAEGSISFEAPDGSTPTFGGRIENGAYRIQDLPAQSAGQRLVRITASRKTGRKVPAGPPFPPSTMIDEIEPVPARYNQKSTTTVELRKGVLNRFDFTLEADPAP